jgi:hypothetical protein
MWVYWPNNNLPETITFDTFSDIYGTIIPYGTTTLGYTYVDPKVKQALINCSGEIKIIIVDNLKGRKRFFQLPDRTRIEC